MIYLKLNLLNNINFNVCYFASQNIKSIYHSQELKRFLIENKAPINNNSNNYINELNNKIQNLTQLHFSKN